MACLVQGRLHIHRGQPNKVKTMLIISFGIKGVVHKEFVLASQTVNSDTTVMFYGYCVKMCKTLATKELTVA
jgi:hypothetical protein